MDKKHPLYLESQLCFPLYAATKELIRTYQPHLDEVGLTYTQFIVMMVLWEHKVLNVKTIGKHLCLDSGTLTPLLRKLEKKGFVTKERSKEDERTVYISISPEGEAIADKLNTLPRDVLKIAQIDDEEFSILYEKLYKMLNHLSAYNKGRK